MACGVCVAVTMGVEVGVELDFDWKNLSLASFTFLSTAEQVGFTDLGVGLGEAITSGFISGVDRTSPDISIGVGSRAGKATGEEIPKNTAILITIFDIQVNMLF